MESKYELECGSLLYSADPREYLFKLKGALGSPECDLFRFNAYSTRDFCNKNGLGQDDPARNLGSQNQRLLLLAFLAFFTGFPLPIVLQKLHIFLPPVPWILFFFLTALATGHLGLV
jgi:hypothetical protein